MILECSNCSTRFSVKDDLLLPKGRKVKCAKCQHIWYQYPPVVTAESVSRSENKPSNNILPDFDEIPEGVKPMPEGSNLPVIKEGEAVSYL